MSTITTAQTQDWEAILPTIQNMYAKGSTDAEFRIFCETARALGLNPILKQIWCVKNLKRPELPAQIYASRDGLITIAHRSGQFDGMESGTKTNENGEMVGYCRIWRKDMTHPFYVEVLRSEYDTKNNLWATHPATMLIKVSESHAFKRAFDICGVYTPDEMGQQGEEQAQIQEAPVSQLRRAAPTPAPQQTQTLVTMEASDFAGNPNDELHCYICGAPIDPTREGMVSKRDFGKYLCLEHLKQAKAEAAADAMPVKPPAPTAPKTVAEPAPEEKRDQPSSSPLAAEIARINAEQEAIDKQVKKPMPAIKPDPHAGITNTCQTCGEPISQTQVKSSLAVSKFALCEECLALMQDIESKKSAVV